jgi:two-component system OmpR family sensor kinase
MVVVVAALAAVGLLVVDVGSVFLLRSYLVQRVDQQLGIEVRRAQLISRVPSDYSGRRGPDIGARTATALYMGDGTLVQGPGTVNTPPDLGGFAALAVHAGQGPYTYDGKDGRWRVQVADRPGRDGIAVAAASMSEIEQTEGTLILIAGGVTLLVLVGIGFAAAKVVAIGLRPLTRMEDAAGQIARGDLSRRVEDADPHTESGRLGTALNTMLVRIETAMADKTASEQRLRQFLADAAHELRTPLTSIQGFAELYRRGGVPAGADLDDAMGAIESEVGRMRLLVNDLLLLARLDEERPLDQRPVDLLAVAADTVRDAHVRVPTRFVLLGPLDDTEDTFDPVTVAGDEARLRQVATNLVANALQHTPDDAEVVVRVGRSPAVAAIEPAHQVPAATAGYDLPPDAPVAVLEVADSGPGMKRADAARAFERLYRADTSRSRRQGGAGLGLSIVAAIVQAHGGRCELWTEPGSGARFRVLLPAGPTPSEDEVDSEVALR